MKKISLLLGVFMLVFTSCNIESVDGDIDSSSNSIVGKWKMIDYTYTGETITSTQGQELRTSFVGEAFNMTNIITFSEDPNVITSEGAFSLRLTSNTLGQTSTQTITDLKAINDGNWERDGDELLTFTDIGDGVMNIDKLTENILVLSVSQELDLSQSGFTAISTVDAVITLERVGSSTPVDNTENKLIINGEEFAIGNALSYFEANRQTADFYYYDLTFLSEGLQYAFGDEGPLVTGTGTLFDFSLISKTRDVKEGEYRHDIGNSDNTPFNISSPISFLNFTFNNNYIYDDFEGQTGYFWAEEFDAATINVQRDGDIYTITGSGTFNGVTFSLQYTGELILDPNSD